ncbi:aspartate/glutamate racemase family protein [Mesorhizobium sp. M0751]|uniref:aspartate/glutamate racemase family protein n=1 Tax=unclassified Mesorhizobium TaxID=325217 RepID=UPI003339E34A
MMLKGGFTNYGEVIGVLMLDTRFPRPVGDIGNAESYPFPVRFKTVKGALPVRIMGDRPQPELIEPFIEAARELEAEGVRAITTSCGFLAPFQRELTAAVGIPVFTSSLLQVPLVSRLIGPSRKVGIFTEREQHMNDHHFNGAGWSAAEVNVHVQGMKADAVFPSVYIGNRTESAFDVLRAEMEAMTHAFLEECPDAGTIVLECTNMCPFSSFIARISGLPVFDINTLINLFCSTSTARPQNHQRRYGKFAPQYVCC